MDQPQKPILAYAPRRMRQWMSVTLIILFAYLASYVAMRISGVVIRYESVGLRMDTSWPGNAIGPGDRGMPDIVLSPWRPIMLAEELIRGTIYRMTR